MSTVQQEIIDRLQTLDQNDQRRVLDFIAHLHEPPQKHYSPRELMRLPATERDRIVAESFKLAEDEDFETFEAYSEEPFGDES